MALIKCPECEREISNKADACPHCGYPIKGNQIPKTKEKKTCNKKLPIFIGLIIIVISVLGIIIGINYSDLNKKYIRAFNNGEMTEAANIYKNISDEKDREKINTYFYKIFDDIYDDFSKSKLDYEKAIARIEDIDNTGILKVHEKANEVKGRITEDYSKTLKEEIDAIYAGFKDKSITYENAIDSINSIAKDSPAVAQASLTKKSITKLNDSSGSFALFLENNMS